MPNTGFLGWAYVTGSVASILDGADGALAYYDGTGQVLNDSAGLFWDNNKSLLEVTGTVDISGTLRAYKYETITHENTTYQGTTKFGNDTADIHQFTGSVQISGATNALLIENGRVGIGTLSPSNQLEIEGSSGDLIFEIDNNASNSANFQIQNGAGNARVDFVMNDGSANTTITMKGQKVGIGDTTPSYTLDVGGNAQVTTDLFVGAKVGIATTAPEHALSVTGTLGVSGDVTLDGNVTLGDAAADVTTVTGQLTASVGLTVAANERLNLGADQEYIYGDGTDIHFAVGSNGDINIPANIGLTFGNDGEIIEGDGSNLTIKGGDINLTAEGDVNIPSGIGLTFGDDGEKIEGDGTNLTIASSGRAQYTATDHHHFTGSVYTNGDAFFGDDVSLTSDSAVFNMGADNDITLTHDGTTGVTLAAAPITLDSGGRITLDSDTGEVHFRDNAQQQGILKMDTSNKFILSSSVSVNDMHLMSGRDIVLDADGADVMLKDGGTQFLKFTNNSGDCEIYNGVADKDIIFKDLGGNEIFRIDGSAESLLVKDDKKIEFGDSAESSIYYSETDGDYLTISGSLAGGVVLSGSSLVFDSVTVTSGTIAGMGSYLGVNSIGQVVLTASSTVSDLNSLSDVTYSSGDLTIASLDTLVVGAFTIDSSGDITLDADGGEVFFHDDAVQQGVLKMDTANKFILSSSVSANDIYLMSGRDIVFDADGADISLQDAGTEFLKFTNSSADCVITNGAADKDILFKDADGNEIFRVDGGEESILVASGKKIMFADTGEYITSDGTDLTIASGGDIILNPSGGDVLPNADNTRNLGAADKRWANVYTGDLHLKNDRGDWTILEEEDYLCVINNKTGKRFRMMLQEIEE